jgi:hypothetical protein
MGKMFAEATRDLHDALDRQASALVRKVDSLRQLARTGSAAIAATLAGVGLLAQSDVSFPAVALAFLASGTFVVLVAIAWSVSVASLQEGVDIPIGPDPEVLRGLDAEDDEGLAASRLELAVRMHECSWCSWPGLRWWQSDSLLYLEVPFFEHEVPTAARCLGRRSASW